MNGTTHGFGLPLQGVEEGMLGVLVIISGPGACLNRWSQERAFGIPTQGKSA